MDENERANYLTDYYNRVGNEHNNARAAFSHAQSISVMLERTGIFLNAGALAVLAAAVANTPKLFTDLFPASGIFLLGTTYAIISSFLTYYNLIAHHDHYSFKAAQAARQINKKYYSDDVDEKCNEKSTEKNISAEISYTYWSGLIAIIVSYIFFILGCYCVALAF